MFSSPANQAIQLFAASVSLYQAPGLIPALEPANSCVPPTRCD